MVNFRLVWHVDLMTFVKHYSVQICPSHAVWATQMTLTQVSHSKPISQNLIQSKLTWASQNLSPESKYESVKIWVSQDSSQSKPEQVKLTGSDLDWLIPSWLAHGCFAWVVFYNVPRFKVPTIGSILYAKNYSPQHSLVKNVLCM